LEAEDFAASAADFTCDSALCADTAAVLAAVAAVEAAPDGFIDVYVDSRSLRVGQYWLGIEPATASAALVLTVPDIADNGAVVPVQILSRLPGTTRLALMVEKNPNTLTAVFEILPDALADVATRIKMAQTSNVVAIAVAEGKVYSAIREVKVTLGGCGT
jgi:sulfur-oxidizing protein SoxY